MKVDIHNYRDKENQPDLHDALITMIQNDTEKKSTKIVATKKFCNERYEFTFSKVYYFELTGFDPWDYGILLSDSCFEDPKPLIDRISVLGKEVGNYANMQKIIDSAISATFTIKSGDRIRILCESIQVEKDNLA